jgi:hypothetical protein
MSDWIDAKILATLANGIIPADSRDEGAASVNAGPKLADKLKTGYGNAIYKPGLAAAIALSEKTFGKPITQLSPEQVFKLLTDLRETNLGFVKMLRMDVCAIYLIDPVVHARIGFPGPSTMQGGYVDFDLPQKK